MGGDVEMLANLYTIAAQNPSRSYVCVCVRACVSESPFSRPQLQMQFCAVLAIRSEPVYAAFRASGEEVLSLAGWGRVHNSGLWILNVYCSAPWTCSPDASSSWFCGGRGLKWMLHRRLSRF